MFTIDMQRNISDTAAAFAPRTPSGLGPNRASGAPPLGTAQRGTVSMPTSPLMMMHHNHWGVPSASVSVADIWNLSHSAQDRFDLPAAAQGPEQPSSPQLFPEHVSPLDIRTPPHPQNAVPWYTSDPLSPINPFPPSQIGGPDTIFSPHSHGDGDHTPLGLGPNIPEGTDEVMDDEQKTGDGSGHVGESEESGPEGCKKRAQVRVACTHCQKACKRCSNMRPCERCQKYGYLDCVDSTRKPRKTGIKRGPYKKRRASKNVSNEPESHTPATSSQPYTGPHPQRPSYRRPQHPAAHNGRHTHNHADSNATTNPHAGHPPPFPQRSNLHPRSSTLPRPQPSSAHPSEVSRHSTSSGLVRAPAQTQDYPPGPRATPGSLSQAFLAAMNGPRWVNGQRLMRGAAGAVFTGSRTGDGGGGGGTWSSIGWDSATTTGQAPSRPSPLYPKTPTGPFPFSLSGADDPFSRAVSPIRQFAYPPGLEGSSGGAGVQGGGEEEGQGDGMASEQQQQQMGEGQHKRPGQSASARPELLIDTTALTPVTSAFPHYLSPSPGVLSPFYIPSKIRKPSLRTLMSATSSCEASPEVAQSPTLFNQPMVLDEGLDLDIMGTGTHLDKGGRWGEGGAGGEGGKSQDGHDGQEAEVQGRGGETPGGQGDGQGDVLKHGETDGGESARTLNDMGFTGFEGLMGFHT